MITGNIRMIIPGVRKLLQYFVLIQFVRWLVSRNYEEPLNGNQQLLSRFFGELTKPLDT